MKPVVQTTITDESMIVTLSVRELRSLIREVVTEALKSKAQHDLLNLKDIQDRYEIGKQALLAGARRGEIELFR